VKKVMAYFSNSDEGSCFDEQCLRCKYGEKPCPIAWVQYTYNYDACNVPVARKILDDLVRDDGTCEMFEKFKDDFKLEGDAKK